MKDILPPSETGLDLGSSDTTAPRAANLLRPQLGSLEYAPQVGVDYAYFLQPDLTFQDESFRSYQTQRLADFGISVTQVADDTGPLSTSRTMFVETNETQEGLVST